MEQIEKNIIQLKKEISNFEERYKRKKNSVLLMAVSKTHSVEKIKTAYLAGQRDFGENYLQESVEKISKLKDLDIVWHFIGSIQSNKAKLIAENFDWVHSIDKEKTLKKINALRKTSGKKLNVCIQVNSDNEETKSGISFCEVEEFLKKTKNLDMINIRGLMAIPKPEETRIAQLESFKKIKNIFDDLVKKGYKLDTLSIGMSSDYNAAIEAGSTVIRIGTAIFGERKK